MDSRVSWPAMEALLQNRLSIVPFRFSLYEKEDDLFSGIAMHSPATHPVASLLPAYEKLGKLPLKVFLTTGFPFDNSASNRKFRSILKNKGYGLKYIEVEAGHDWGNWRPLMDDALLYFYGI